MVFLNSMSTNGQLPIFHIVITPWIIFHSPLQMGYNYSYWPLKWHGGMILQKIIAVFKPVMGHWTSTIEFNDVPSSPSRRSHWCRIFGGISEFPHSNLHLQLIFSHQSFVYVAFPMGYMAFPRVQMAFPCTSHGFSQGISHGFYAMGPMALPKEFPDFPSAPAAFPAQGPWQNPSCPNSGGRPPRAPSWVCRSPEIPLGNPLGKSMGDALEIDGWRKTDPASTKWCPHEGNRPKKGRNWNPNSHLGIYVDVLYLFVSDLDDVLK